VDDIFPIVYSVSLSNSPLYFSPIVFIIVAGAGGVGWYGSRAYVSRHNYDINSFDDVYGKLFDALFDKITNRFERYKLPFNKNQEKYLFSRFARIWVILVGCIYTILYFSIFILFFLF
jgi:hypothetical protein